MVLAPAPRLPLYDTLRAVTAEPATVSVAFQGWVIYCPGLGF
ncbi:hypothetical protein [Micromonospora purpureochromogenes]